MFRRFASAFTRRAYRSFCSSSAPSGRLDGKVAIVTGGAAGIGRASATRFAQEGCKVLVADKNLEGAQETTQSIIDAGGDAVACSVDVTSAKDVEFMVEQAESYYGGLHILFNNAGIMHMDDGNAQETNENVWDLTFDINVKGVWFGCRYGIPAIIRSGGGSIINTASFVSKMGAATPQLAYTASKGAVSAMTRELAVVHARDNVRVNALCPGPLRTKLLMDFLDTEEKKQRRLVHVPMGRFGEAEEMAGAALFLASDDSAYVNGTDFMVDGGIHSAYVTPE